jgi:RNA recognition motif-containing protein
MEDLQACLASMGLLDGFNTDLGNMNNGDIGEEQASRTLFLGDLSYFCKEEDLCALFQGYGPIIAVSVRRGVSGESLMHGFVALQTAEQARKIIIDMNGIEFMGRNLK